MVINKFCIGDRLLSEHMTEVIIVNIDENHYYVKLHEDDEGYFRFSKKFFEKKFTKTKGKIDCSKLWKEINA